MTPISEDAEDYFVNVCKDCMACDPVEIYELWKNVDGLIWRGCKHNFPPLTPRG